MSPISHGIVRKPGPIYGSVQFSLSLYVGREHRTTNQVIWAQYNLGHFEARANALATFILSKISVSWI